MHGAVRLMMVNDAGFTSELGWDFWEDNWQNRGENGTISWVLHNYHYVADWLGNMIFLGIIGHYSQDDDTGWSKHGGFVPNASRFHGQKSFSTVGFCLPKYPMIGQSISTRLFFGSSCLDDADLYTCSWGIEVHPQWEAISGGRKGRYTWRNYVYVYIYTHPDTHTQTHRDTLHAMPCQANACHPIPFQGMAWHCMHPTIHTHPSFHPSIQTARQTYSTYRHAYMHTCIHAYMYTDRQTDIETKRHIQCRILISVGPPPQTIFGPSLMWKFWWSGSWKVCSTIISIDFELIWHWFQLILNWFQLMLNWFWIDFNWCWIDFELISIDVELISIDVELILKWIQLILNWFWIDFNRFWIDFWIDFNWFQIDFNWFQIDFNWFQLILTWFQ